MLQRKWVICFNHEAYLNQDNNLGTTYDAATDHIDKAHKFVCEECKNEHLMMTEEEEGVWFVSEKDGADWAIVINTHIHKINLIKDLDE